MQNEIKRVKLSSLKPNLYRDIENYPLSETKIETLIESIGSTGWWANINCRKVRGGYEIAFGHHRLEALRRHLGESASVEVLVRDITDGEMLKMMARENSEDWATSAWHELETIKMTVQAFADGEIEFGDIGSAKRYRVAPGFVENPKSADSADFKYTMGQVAEFLGWTKQNGGKTEPDYKCRTAFAALELAEQGWLDLKSLRDLTREQCSVTVKEARATLSHHKKEEKRAAELKESAEKRAAEAKTARDRKRAEQAKAVAAQAEADHKKAQKTATKKVAKEVAKTFKEGGGIREVREAAKKTRPQAIEEVQKTPDASAVISDVVGSLKSVLTMKKNRGEFVSATVMKIDGIASVPKDVFSDSQVQAVIDCLEDVKNRCDTLISKLESRS